MFKILICDINYVPGLSRAVYLTRMRYWRKRNCQITVFSTKEGERFYRRQIDNLEYIIFNYRHHFRGPYSLIWDVLKINILALFHLRKLINRFDAVYSLSSVIDFLFIPWVLKLFDKKVRWFVMVDNIVPPPGRRPGSFFKQIFPYLAFLLGNFFLKTKAKGIFVISDFLKNYYQKLGVKATKIGESYGVEKELFTGKISPSVPKIDALYCGRLHLAKGIMDLVEVARIVAKTKKHFKMGILGDGEESVKRQFLEEIKTDGLEKNFLLFGYVDDKPKGDIYRRAGLFIFLSYDEGCPHAVIEAFACNKQVLAYDLPIYHEVFAKYLKTGQLILFKLKDYSSIADHILRFSPGKRYFSNKLDDYSWEKLAQNELEAMKNA